MIDFLNIHKSIEFYERMGYVRVESPWTVSKKVSAITKPDSRIDYELIHNGKVLVASGEQSFLYLYLKGFLPLGKYQTVTPCFRDEKFDLTHTKYFIKNELIITDNVTNDALNTIIFDSIRFFKSILSTPNNSDIKILKTSELSYDILYKNIELGSYGIRECDFLKWIYGTGCAEPRLSYCQNLK